LVVCAEKKGVASEPNEGERWGCLVQDRHSRFVVACATGPLSEDLIEQAVTTTVQRTHQRPLCWFSDGWHGYGSILERTYRQRVLTGKRGRPRLVVPQSVSLTQTVKHRDEHGRLLSVEMRATPGARMEQADTVHVERLNGALRDRLAALTRKTHAFAKRDATFDALVGLQLFDHHFHASSLVWIWYAPDFSSRKLSRVLKAQAVLVQRLSKSRVHHWPR
jgi:hypothetical protein